MAGRPRTEIDKELFINTINDAENEQQFDSMLALHKFIGEVLDLPFYTVANRIKEWGLTLKTQPGKRGRPAGSSGCTARPKKQETTEGPDLSELLAAFAPLKIKSSADLLTWSGKTHEQNEAIREAWRTLRLALDMPHGNE